MQRSPCFMFTSFIGASSSSTTSWRVIATSTGRRTPTRVLRVRRNGIGHLIPSAQPQPVTRARAAAQSLHSIKGHQRPWIAECARVRVRTIGTHNSSLVAHLSDRLCVMLSSMLLLLLVLFVSLFCACTSAQLDAELDPGSCGTDAPIAKNNDEAQGHLHTGECR